MSDKREIRFSFCLQPMGPIAESLELIELVDQLGFYACYSVDETSAKDMWAVMAAAASRTKRIRLGPNVTHVFLREPTLIAQSLATLDELTDGRVEAVISSGSFALLEKYGAFAKPQRPISRVKESLQVMRQFLDHGSIDFEGEFFSYKGLMTMARPVQERLPLMMGGMRGPRSFQIAGEFSDGLHHALSYSREAYDYAVDNVKIGAERGGRDWRTLDIAAVVNVVLSDDSAAARAAARPLAAVSAPTMAAQQFERHGIGAEQVQPILDALAIGEIGKAVDSCSPEMAAKLSVAGTPEECAEQIAQNLLPAGVNHIVLIVTDPTILASLTGGSVETFAGVPSVPEQLRLVMDRLVPALL